MKLLTLLTVAVLLVIGVRVYAAFPCSGSNSTPCIGAKVNAGQTCSIRMHTGGYDSNSICQRIINSNGVAVFIPTHSVSEMKSFTSAYPNGGTVNGIRRDAWSCVTAAPDCTFL